MTRQQNITGTLPQVSHAWLGAPSPEAALRPSTSPTANSGLRVA
jgi:hypothetical protein